MPDFIIAFIISYYPIENSLWQKGAELCKYIFSLVHNSKQPKKPGIRSNRHRHKIASNADQSRISKNYTYSKRDVTELAIQVINFIIKKLQNYIVNKTISQVNTDPLMAAKEHFALAVDILFDFDEIVSLFWIGSYEYNFEMIQYYKNLEKINNLTFTTNKFKKSTEDEKIIDILLGKSSQGYWFLAFISDSLELSSKFNLLDAFRVVLENESTFNDGTFLKII